jgi:pilus assembly protein CpaC
MFPSRGAKSKWAAGAILLFFVLSTACWSWAAGSSPADTQTVKRLNLVAGKSILLKTEQPVTRITLANPEVADFVLLSPRELYITGHTAGATNMTLWQDKDNYQLIDVEVGFDVSGLKQSINDTLPEETDLYITSARDSVTLMGRVSSASNLAHVMSLAQSYAPKEKIVNLLNVGGVQQVMLEIRVAEMQRNVAQSIGVNFNYITESGKFFVHQLGGLATVDTITSPVTSLTSTFSSSVNALFNFDNNGTNWNVFIDALKADGLAKVLAEPTLIALSGESASFLAGGEFPIPVPDEDGIGIEYKEFGVALSFTPVVLSDNRINIRVRPEVSELDYASGVELSGYIVPGLTTRKAETVIELADGQSFAIAGLLRENTRDAISKYPLLGDIPILGALFRSRSYQKAETELVIIATPRLVKPYDASKQVLPTDFYNEPDDVDIYLLGVMEGKGGKKAKGIQGELDGDFGHAMPAK